MNDFNKTFALLSGLGGDTLIIENPKLNLDVILYWDILNDKTRVIDLNIAHRDVRRGFHFAIFEDKCKIRKVGAKFYDDYITGDVSTTLSVVSRHNFLSTLPWKHVSYKILGEKYDLEWRE